MRQRIRSALSLSSTAVIRTAEAAKLLNASLPTARANEIRLSTAGGVVGAIGGATLIGGMGLAALGTAIPVAGFAAVGVVGIVIGNKIGSEIDRRKISRQDPDHQADHNQSVSH